MKQKIDVIKMDRDVNNSGLLYRPSSTITSSLINKPEIRTQLEVGITLQLLLQTSLYPSSFCKRPFSFFNFFFLLILFSFLIQLVLNLISITKSFAVITMTSFDFLCCLQHLSPRLIYFWISFCYQLSFIKVYKLKLGLNTFKSGYLLAVLILFYIKLPE